jgi:cell division protein FtsB
MHSDIKQLEDTCERLQRENNDMEQQIEDMIRKDEEDRLTE